MLLTGSMLLGMVRASTHDGYLTSPSATFSTTGYALATRVIRLHADTWETGWKWPGGTIRVRGPVHHPHQAGRRPRWSGYPPGIGHPVPARQCRDLGGQGHWLRDPDPDLDDTPRKLGHRGHEPGRCAGLTIQADGGARHPALQWVAVAMIAGGAVLAGGGVLMVVIPVRRARRDAFRPAAPGTS